MKNKLILILVLVVSAALAGLAFVASAPVPAVCGDGVVQSPNDAGLYEKCDDGTGSGAAPVPAESASCTAQCGQKMLGWAWADNGGWISLNKDNCNYLSGTEVCGATAPAIDYFVQVDANNDVRGWGWSDNLGWVCFGQTCDQAHICELAGGSPCVPTNFGTGIPETAGTSGWRAYIKDNGESNPPVLGWGKILALKDEGWLNLSCQNDNSCTAGATVDTQIYLTKGLFGLAATPEKRFSLKGYGFSSGSLTGVGWVAFSPEIVQVQPWLQTQYGDIYSNKGLSGQPAPQHAYNATYRILSSGQIVGFSSAQVEPLWVEGGVQQINFPTAETRYSNALGELDVLGLVCDFGTADTCVNKYGNTVVNISKNPLQSTQTLGGKIYYSPTSLSIGSANPIKLSLFKNGINFENGAGTIIVNGDLTINNDILYDNSSSLTKFRNLASVAWIVKGDLKIGSGVKTLAGNFVVIGNDTACSATGVGPAGCGQVFSCYNGVNCGQNGLLVNGLIMARKFNFARTFAPPTGLEASEGVIYDGRLLANTPPGLGDFAKSLPVWRPNFSN
ncbi:MAG: hypothetical protein WCX71_03360 [Candidatus Buchananbacteria bacterium]